MKRTLLILGMLTALGAAQALAGGFTYKTIDNPNTSTYTNLNGVDGKNIVGQYLDASGNTHSFLFDGSAFTPMADDPLSASGTTTAVAISGTTIVGNYQDTAGTWTIHSFVYGGSSYATVDHPDYVPGFFTRSYISGIDGQNMVGFYFNDRYHGIHSFLRSQTPTGPVFTPLSDPDGPDYTNAAGICGKYVVGYYNVASGVDHGFIYDGTAYTTIDDPLGTNGTYALGINGPNVVGEYFDSAYVSHGFLYNGKSYTTIDDPLAVNDPSTGIGGTVVSAISGNMIVGSYYDADNVWHGFEATIPSDFAAPGDANLDGKVDDNDLGILLGAWGTGANWAHGDFNHDGLVDDNDLGALLSAWTGSGAAAPEPITLSLLALGGAALLRRRNK